MRSYLFVPADSERKLEKAPGSGADCLLIDLEDSVSHRRKPAGRAMAADDRGNRQRFLKKRFDQRAGRMKLFLAGDAAQFA